MKEENNKKKKLTLKELWNHPIYSPLIKLGLWGIFFIVIYAFIFIGQAVNKNNKTIRNINNNTTTKASKLNYTKMKNNLINNDQNIKYQIGDYYITGTISNGILNATLEDSADIIYKIKYDGENLYQIKRQEEVIRDDLLVDINQKYLLPSNILTITEDSGVIVTKSEDEKVYSYNVDNKAISIYLGDDKIDRIVVLDNDITYDLTFGVDYEA